MISFWCRILSGKHEKISYKMYRYIIDQHDSMKWPEKIKDILTSVGRPDIWHNQFNININNIHRQIKQTLIDQFKQQWHEQLQQSNKGLIFNSFKQVHRFEHYLNSLSQSDSMNILRYRTANHFLPV